MSKRFAATAIGLMFAGVAAAISFSPAAKATPVTYDFTVDVTTGSLAGTSSSGSFSYDSSTILPGVSRKEVGLLTALDFTFNGIAYDASTANTAWLTFDAAGNLTSFNFGTWCEPGSCATSWAGNDWYVFVSGDYRSFSYITPATPGASGKGTVTWSPAAVAVPEPATLGMFGIGVLLVGACCAVRRRSARRSSHLG